MVGSDASIGQFPDEAVDVNLSAAGLILISVIAVLVFAQQAVIGSDVAFQVGVICPGGMHHNAFRSYGSACLVAGVIGKNQFSQIHHYSPRHRLIGYKW